MNLPDESVTPIVLSSVMLSNNSARRSTSISSGMLSKSNRSTNSSAVQPLDGDHHDGDHYPGDDLHDLPMVKFGEKRTEGSVFDFYQVTRLLGGSENSGVYLCLRKEKRGQWNSSEGLFRRRKQRGNCEEFTMKYLRINSLDNGYTEASLERFFEQLDKVKDLRHPHLVRMYEYFERYGKVYMLMEHCYGGNLVSRLPYSETEAAKIICNIVSAVKCIHNSNMLHLSLNLENILFSDDNPKKMDIKLADFGLARKLDRRTIVREGSEKNYAAAPETFSGSFSAQSDVWSIGVIAYILLSRKAPFGGDNMVEQIKRCRYSFDEPVWSRISKEAKNFVASCLELDPSKRLTLKEATRHPWFSPKWRLSATPSVSIPNHEKNRVYDAMNEAAFKGRAINTIAEVSSMEEIVNVAQWCFHFDTGKTGMTTYGELKLGLQTNGYSATDIDSIYVDSSVDNEGPLEFRDFLASCLEARGSFEETILTETFERSFPDEDSYITKYEVAGLLTAVGTPERVEEFFPDWDELKGEDSRITFTHFLRAFHLKSREYSTKIACSPAYSITLAMTVNCLAALPPNDPFAGRAKYKKLGILGGSEVAAVYAVRRADDPIDDDTSHTGRGLSSFTSFTNRSKVTTDQEFMMKTFQGTTPEAEDKIRKEIRALKLLNHRNVVKIYDSFQEHGQIYIVTDLYVGGNLASRLPYTEQEAARIVMQLLSGVKYLHDQDIVHTALSMETVLFNSGSDDAEIKIVNLGISRKFLNQEMFTPEAEDQGLYSASPESFRGVHTKKGDMWSIGVIAYYLVSGSKPFWGKRWLEKLQNAEVWFEADVWNTVSKEATNFIAALLNLDITQRPDASKAMSYRWIAWNSLPTMVRSRSEDETRSEPCLRCEEFNRVAMNIMAQRLADEQIIELISTFVEEEENRTIATYEDFKVLLYDADYGYVVEGIATKCPDFGEDRKISVFGLLHATLGARGHVLQDFFQLEIMNEFAEVGGSTSYVSRSHLADMLERTGALVDVLSIFDAAGLQGDDNFLIAFEEFQRIFRKLRFEAIRDRLKSEMVPTTIAASVATQETTEHDAHARFELVQRLGGKDDIVFEVAERNSSGSKGVCGGHFVLKVFRLNRFDEVVGRKVQIELMQQLNLIKTMNHNGIMRIHDISQHFNHIHVVSDIYTGGTLRERLPYPEEEVVRIIKQLLSALEYLHSHNVVHGCLSLDNVMFETEEDDSAIKLISFGLARKYLSVDFAEISTENLCESELEWSEVYASSPESLSERVFTKESDMWSLGVIAYIMLAGHLPFSGSNMKEEITAGAFDFERPVWEQRSKHAWDFVASLLHVDPALRLDAKRSLRHRWFRLEASPAPVMSRHRKCQQFNRMLTELAYQQTTLNCLAFHCSIPDILHLMAVLRNSSSCRLGFVSSLDFQKLIGNCGFSDELVEKIFRNVDLDGGGFEYDDFLSKVVVACGRMLELQLAKGFDAMGANNISLRAIQEIIGSPVADVLSVDAIFEKEDRLSFPTFLHRFDDHVTNFFQEQILSPANEDYRQGLNSPQSTYDRHRIKITTKD